MFYLQGRVAVTFVVVLSLDLAELKVLNAWKLTLAVLNLCLISLWTTKHWANWLHMHV